MHSRAILLILISFSLAFVLSACLSYASPTVSDATGASAAQGSAALPSTQSPTSASPSRPHPPLAPKLGTNGGSIPELIPLGPGATWVYSVTVDRREGFGPLHDVSTVTDTIVSLAQEGNGWIFVAETSGEIYADTPPYDRSYFLVAFGPRLYQLFESQDPVDLIRSNGAGFEGEQIAAWPLGIGQSWGSPSLGLGQSDLYYRWVVEAYEEVLSPAGVFPSCARVGYHSNAGVTTRWYCPGVGLVRYQDQERSTWRIEVWELLEYRSGDAQ